MKYLPRRFAAAIVSVWLAAAGFGVAAQTPPAPGTPNGVQEVQVAADKFQKGVPAPSWVEPSPAIPATEDKSPAVLLLADSQLYAGATPAYYVHRAWQVNSPAVLADVGRYSIEFMPEYQHLSLHGVHLIRGGASIDKLASSRITFLQRETGLEQGMYTGMVTALVLIDDVRVGDVLDIEYTTEGQNPVYGGRYYDAASWDQRTRTELRRVTLLAPKSREIEWKMLGERKDAKDVEPKETTVGDMKRWEWLEKGVARAELEPNTPAYALPVRYLQFTEAHSWSEITDWAEDLFAMNTAPSPEVVELSKQFAARPSDEEKTAAALQWVQNEIRYFSLSLGESSHRPALPLVTIQRRWGDCKDKAVLLVQLLRAMKIDAQPVLVSTQGEPGRLMPTPTAFDHVIVRAQVNGRDYFLDATRQGQSGKLDAMGQVWETASVLVVEKGNRKFTRISTPERKQLVASDLHEVITATKFEDDATLVATQTFTGVSAEVRRLLFGAMPRTSLEKGLMENYEKRYPGVQLVKLDIQDDPQDNRYTVVLTMKGPKLFVNAGTSWGVRYFPSNMTGMLPVPASQSRLSMLALPAPGIVKYTLDVDFPPEVAVTGDPARHTVRDPAFDFSVQRVFRGNHASAMIELDAFERTVDADRVKSYTANVRRLNDADPGYFFVTKASMKSPATAADATPGVSNLRRTLEQRLTAQVASITKAIDAGTLSGDDLVNAYCTRADLDSDLGKIDDSLKDANEAIKLNPANFTALRCRGQAYYYKGDYPKAIADYSKALLTAPPDEAAGIYYNRGQAKHYAGQFASAIEDFEKSTTVTGKASEENIYPELWRAWSQQKAGMKPTEAQMKFAADNARGEWPRPALAMLHGVITVDQMLATLDNKKGDDRDMNLTEAYFYAGQYYLVHGDKAKAKEYFKMTRDKGVIVYGEHVAAGIELSGLGQ